MICLDSVSRVLIYRVKFTYFTLRTLPIKVALPTNVCYKHSLWNLSLYLWDFIIWVPLNLSSCPKRLPQLDTTDFYQGSGPLAQQLLQQLSGVSVHAPSTISQQPFLSPHWWNETHLSKQKPDKLSLKGCYNHTYTQKSTCPFSCDVVCL